MQEGAEVLTVRLIDADALDLAFAEMRFSTVGKLKHWGDREDWCLHGEEIEELIESAPTIDAVPVVRCKDCEYSYDEISYLCCSHGVCVDCEVPPNFYCAEGKRKEPDE